MLFHYNWSKRPELFTKLDHLIDAIAHFFVVRFRQNAAITQDMLMNVSMPRGVLIAALIRGKNVEIATGLTQIEAGDRVYVFVLPESISKAERLFERR